jgi:BASS family bile acid:Na+ symporter
LFPRIASFVTEQFFWLLLGAYAAAALCPAPGLWITRCDAGALVSAGHARLPLLILASVFLIAGLSVRYCELRNLARGRLIVVGGLLANVAVPLGLVLVVSGGLRFWHNAKESEALILGLTLVATMPIAGTSTAWSQNSHADMSLSLALVLFSTCLCPLVMPAVLWLVDMLAIGRSSQEVIGAAGQGAGSLLAMWVVLPALAGLVTFTVVGEKTVAGWKPFLRLVNCGNLLLLNYANAAVTLPSVAVDPDWDFLVLTLGTVAFFCAAAFASGWLTGHVLRADHAQQTSLMYALGMSNNGSGLVIATAFLGDQTRALLAIVLYNVAQHVFAALVCRRRARKTGSGPCRGLTGAVVAGSGGAFW